jgi:hypothetical protein
MENDRITGSCACGAVRFTARGAPVRAGLCHCMTCRKSHAAAFNPFVIFRREHVQIEGAVKRWRSSDHYERCFCQECGSRIYGAEIGGDELELSLGSLDEPALVEPLYESWVIRREPWLQPLAVPQHVRDRPEDWTPSTVPEAR